MLKCEASHYEYVRLPGKDIAALWPGAVVPKFAGHRGGGGLDFSQYAESSTTSGRPVSKKGLDFSQYAASSGPSKAGKSGARKSPRLAFSPVRRSFD